MAITVYENSIVIGGTTISNTPTGIRIDGGSSSTLKGFTAAVIRNEYSAPTMGSTYAYAYGQGPASMPPAFGTPRRYIVNQRWSFASQANAVDFGDINVGNMTGAACSSSTTHGFMLGYENFLKYPFAASTTSITDIPGGIPSPQRYGSYIGSGQQSSISGYAGPSQKGGAPPQPYNRSILKYPFATNSAATAIGDSLRNRSRADKGHSSAIYGYVTGGVTDLYPPQSNISQMEKFTFASDAPTVDFGLLGLTNQTSQNATISSQLNGYIAYTQSTPATVDVIQKFPFVVDSNSYDVGDLPASARSTAAGGNSYSGGTGFVVGGYVAPYTGFLVSNISSFPFANDSTSAAAGSLLFGTGNVTTHQV